MKTTKNTIKEREFEYQKPNARKCKPSGKDFRNVSRTHVPKNAYKREKRVNLEEYEDYV